MPKIVMFSSLVCLFVDVPAVCYYRVVIYDKYHLCIDAEGAAANTITTLSTVLAYILALHQGFSNAVLSQGKTTCIKCVIMS